MGLFNSIREGVSTVHEDARSHILHDELTNTLQHMQTMNEEEITEIGWLSDQTR
jgi:RPA family protein